MLEGIDDGNADATESLSLPDRDEQQLREEKRGELADRPSKELRAEQERMKDEEHEWRGRYGVDDPDELEDSISEEMNADERREWRRVVYYWHRNRHVRQMVEGVFDGD